MPGFSIPNNKDLSPSAKVEVLRQHRWRLVIPQLNQTAVLFAKSATRPKQVVDVITIHHGRREAYRPGKMRWEPITVTFYETYSKTELITELVEEWRRTIYEIDDQMILYDDQKSEVSLIMTDNRGHDAIEYILVGAWPSEITPGEVSYEVNDLSTLEITITYDAVMLIAGTPV